MDILTIWLGIIIIPTLMITLIPLVNAIFNTEVKEVIETVIDNIEFYIWSFNTNLLLIMIASIMAIKVVKFILKLIKPTE